MPLKRLFLLSGLLQITQSLQQSSIPISTSLITLFGKKVQKMEATQSSQYHWKDVLCSPICRRTFYLRLLLITVKGPESWDDLRRFQGVLHPTFKAACVTHGLLEDDGGRNVLKRLEICKLDNSFIFSLSPFFSTAIHPHTIQSI